MLPSVSRVVPGACHFGPLPVTKSLAAIGFQPGDKRLRHRGRCRRRGALNRSSLVENSAARKPERFLHVLQQFRQTCRFGVELPRPIKPADQLVGPGGGGFSQGGKAAFQRIERGADEAGSARLQSRERFFRQSHAVDDAFGQARTKTAARRARRSIPAAPPGTTPRDCRCRRSKRSAAEAEFASSCRTS